MLQQLRDEIEKELSRISSERKGYFASLGESLSTTKKDTGWKEAVADELEQINDLKDTLKERNDVIKRWQDLESRRLELKNTIQELEAAYGNIRGDLEIHFEDIGTAAFDLYQREPSSFDDTADLLQDMQDLDDGIREKEKELQQLRSETKAKSFFSKTLKKGRGIVIKGSLKTRELQRGKRLKMVGEHICETGILPELPEGSSLARQLAPLRETTEELRETKQRLSSAREEVEIVDKERIAIERGAKMRNPVRNIEHEISRINTELEEIYFTLGEKFHNSPEKETPPSARISRAVKLIDGNDKERLKYEKLLNRVNAALEISDLEQKKQKLAEEQAALSARIEALDAEKVTMEERIAGAAKIRGNPDTLKLPEKEPEAD